MRTSNNFFTTVLTTILAELPDADPSQQPRGLTLADLDNVRYAGIDAGTDRRIHSEKLRRLKNSPFTVLNQEELRKVMQAVGLTPHERIRLVAAIAATKVQAELTPRIGSRRAYLAAERLHPLIVEGMQELEADDDFGGTFKSGGGAPMPELTEFDRHYQSALTAIDHGLLALNGVTYLDALPEKRAAARQAYDAFTQAMTFLDKHPQSSASWHYWHQEAAHGQQEAGRYLV